MKQQRWHFWKIGDAGKSIVIVASPLILGRTYFPLAKKLAKNYRITIVELLGSGESSRLTTPISFEEHSLHLAQILEGLSLQGAIVIGHSNSGAPVIELAASRPDLIDGIVLADTIGIPPHRRSFFKTAANRALDSLLEPRLTIYGPLHLLKNAIAHTRNFFEQIKISSKLDLTSRLKDVQVPVLIAWGKLDHTLPRHCARSFASLLRHASLYFSKMGSHDWLIERSGEFSSLFSNWEKSIVSSEN